jgi:cellulose synthase/poly-beta-1,6-N-acetylglucosamine synthase-like glycosyltransferase
MDALLNSLLLLIAIALTVPALVLTIECVASLLPPRRASGQCSSGRRPSVVVLVPAHNEAARLGATLDTIRPQLAAADGLLVVADNCTDHTAEVARSAGASVIERTDIHHRGKGYALHYAISHLAVTPPDVLIVVDADCAVSPGAIDCLAKQAWLTDRPAQAQYLMTSGEPSDARSLVSQLAVTIKNHVRPLGLSRLALPCLLTGSGMAFPWRTISTAQLAGNIVEDMQLSIDLLLCGDGTRYCPAAQVVAELPLDQSAARTQRTRWEHGHLQTLWRQCPRLFTAAFRQRRVELLAAALDLAVPPLSLYAVCLLSAVMIAAIWGLIGGAWTAATVLLPAGMLAVTAVLIAGWRHLPQASSWTAVLAIPRYALLKTPIYLAFINRRQKEWVRTARGAS